MRDHDDLTQRLLGDISSDSLDLMAPLTRRRQEWVDRLTEPVTWGWLLPILGALLLLLLFVR
jgi:hypothetical protein